MVLLVVGWLINITVKHLQIVELIFLKLLAQPIFEEIRCFFPE